MSKKFALLMQKVNLATDLRSKILEDQLAYRARFVGRGDYEDPITQKKTEDLLKSVEARIPYLTTLLPIVENGKRYQSVGKWQKNLDAAFDQFLKSHLLPDVYFRLKKIDLDVMLAEWDKVLADEGELDRKYTVVGPFRSQVETGKTKKAEKKTDEERRIDVLNQEIQKLEDNIAKILDEGSRSVINGESKVVSLDLVSDWQNEWKVRFSNLLASFPGRDLEDQKSALKLVFDSVIKSGDLVINSIIPAEQQLSQMEYWLNYISTCSEIDQDMLDSAGVQVLQSELKGIFNLLTGIPIFWAKGDLEIDALERAQKFLDKWYDPFVLMVGDVLRGVNWKWFPGYNDGIEGPFLFESESHVVKAKLTHGVKDGIYISPSQRQG